MKIGLLTFHDTNNFGSMLQTYGLYKTIVNLGFDCEVIDYQCPSIVRREVPQPYHLSLSPHSILHDYLHERHLRKKYRRLKSFLSERMVLSARCGRDSIQEITDCYDTLLIGSDIVWGLDITADDLTYFLDFASERKCRKLSYAASIGNPWTERQKRIVAPLLNKFNYITVREEESAFWVKEVSNCGVDVVCDPTMLLTSDEWIKEVGLKSREHKNYILVYFTKGDCLKRAIEYSTKTGLKVLVVGYGVSRSRQYRFVQPHSLSDFLSLIYYADIVFTASYHGLLFSTYFNKKFVYFNITHPSRMATIAKRLGVEQLDATCGFPEVMTIDYQNVNKNIQLFKQQSVETLEAMLKS